MLQLESARRVYAPRPPRTAGIVFITVLHTAAIYAFLTALEFVPMPSLPHVLEWRTLPPPDRRDVEPPPPLPPLELPEIVNPVAPEVQINIDRGPNNAIVIPEAVPLPVTPPTPPVQVIAARGIMGTHTIPEYPILARRLGEQGTVRLGIVIGADGMVSEAQIRQSSGSKRLDDAAVEWVKQHWRYQPAMRGNMPVPSTAEANLQFKLY